MGTNNNGKTLIIKLIALSLFGEYINPIKYKKRRLENKSIATSLAL